MPLLTIGNYHINTDRIVTVLTPERRQHKDRTRPNQGVSDTAAVVVLAGSEDLELFDEDADAMRAWLASQGQSAAEPKGETSKTAAPTPTPTPPPAAPTK